MLFIVQYARGNVTKHGWAVYLKNKQKLAQIMTNETFPNLNRTISSSYHGLPWASKMCISVPFLNGPFPFCNGTTSLVVVRWVAGFMTTWFSTALAWSHHDKFDHAPFCEIWIYYFRTCFCAFIYVYIMSLNFFLKIVYFLSCWIGLLPISKQERDHFNNFK